MSHRGEIERLSRCARPDVGIITCIGVSHIGNLGSQENICKAKLEICEGLPNGAPAGAERGRPVPAGREAAGACPPGLVPAWGMRTRTSAP